jgi:hypothetical protein
LLSIALDRARRDPYVHTRFPFADAYWFRVPLKVLVITVTVFGLVSLWPALTNGTPDDNRRAIFALLVVLFFMGAGITVAVAISDSYVDLDADVLFVRFEAFFSAEVAVADIIAVRAIDPRPRWRYRFGLSTDFVERICCSHGGPLIEIQLAHPWPTRVWPRRLDVRRFWLAVGDHDRFVIALQQVAPHAFPSTRDSELTAA